MSLARLSPHCINAEVTVKHLADLTSQVMSLSKCLLKSFGEMTHQEDVYQLEAPRSPSIAT